MSIKQELQSPTNRIAGSLALSFVLFMVAIQLFGIGTPMLSAPTLF